MQGPYPNKDLKNYSRENIGPRLVIAVLETYSVFIFFFEIINLQCYDHLKSGLTHKNMHYMAVHRPDHKQESPTQR